MDSLIFGVAVMGASIALFWYCIPRGGRELRIITIPGLDLIIPVLTLIGLVVGAGLIGVGTGALK